jgi:hypothetical protein
MQIAPKIDVRNLVRELAENKVDSLELLREALSNAKDHHASRIWIRTTRGPRNEVSVLLVDDGDGMDQHGLEAFWGVGASAKPARCIGYKGHGTKLYFGSQRLTVATRPTTSRSWQISVVDDPPNAAGNSIDVRDIGAADGLHSELTNLGLIEGTGTAILIENIRFGDGAKLLNRRAIESFCDWFSVIGDIRSGLFETRIDFHAALNEGGAATESLRPHEGAIHPIEVNLQVNGESRFFPIGFGPTAQDKEFFARWADDIAANKPGVVAFGHRFADQNVSAAGAHRIRDDLTALRLTTPENWVNEDGIAIVARVEGHRRQRETYLEASWQNHPGLYGFENRFGLWLCRDFIPIVQRNDLLKQALERASKGRLQFDFNTTRNWQVFLNYQEFLPTSNRNDISNQRELESKFVQALVDLFSQALKDHSFQEWVLRLRRARHERQRNQEMQYMDDRREDVERWLRSPPKGDAVDAMAVAGLRQLESDDTLVMRAPRSEQELFYLYGLLSARYEMPIQILEYDTHEGVDAIAQVRNPALISPRNVHGRIEFKFDVSANNAIDHFFDAIDAIVCWKVDRTGQIYEQTSSGDTIGRLQKRAAPLLSPAIDTHEIVYMSGKIERVIPVLQIAELFASTSGKKRR